MIRSFFPILRTTALALLSLLLPGCFGSPGPPQTSEDRYNSAAKELAAAENDQERFYALRDAAKSAFEVGRTDEARDHAQKLLDFANAYPRDWNYGNAIHDGHMVLGRVALKSGDVEAAKRELLLAGHTPGSPQLDSFGPNMSLAKDLLERKETATVVDYFALCAVFWDMGRTKLKDWTIQAKAGDVPDFGPNLVY